MKTGKNLSLACQVLSKRNLRNGWPPAASGFSVPSKPHLLLLIRLRAGYGFFTTQRRAWGITPDQVGSTMISNPVLLAA